MTALSVNDYLRQHIRTVPDWPAPGVQFRDITPLLQDQREARYGLLRGYFHGADDDASTGRDQARLTSLTLPPGAQSLGQPLAQLTLHAIGVRVVSVRHGSGRVAAPDEHTPLAEGDTLVLSGHPTALALAEDKLLRGG